MRRALLIAFGGVTLYHVMAVSWGWPNPFWLMPLNTLLQWGFALAHALPTLGRLRALLLLGLTFGISMGMEAIGVATGWIYGPYVYTGRLGPLLLGVPVLIPFAWFMMAYPALIVACQVLDESPIAPRRPWGVAALAAIWMTAWDLALDPVMTRMGFWVWKTRGPYFGVPLQNFAGWMVTMLLIYGAYLGVSSRWPSPVPAPPGAPRMEAVLAYALAGAPFVLYPLLNPRADPTAQTLGLIAFFTMGPPVLIATLRSLSFKVVRK
ncbi:MAG TPA: carotenoid biosynthesis protein [Thermoflexus sp.]|nr:carotenoid biosynthesis protein [Thermoflexus sp.]